MSKYIKIGTYKDKFLYYNPENDGFYAIDEGFFASDIDIINKEKEIEIIKNISTPITDEDEIKAIKMANYYVMDHIEKGKRLYASIHKLHERDVAQKVIESKRIRRGRAISLILLAFTLLHKEIFAVGHELKTGVDDYIDYYHSTHQNDEKHLELFISSLDSNETLNPKVRLLIQNNLNTLVASDAYIPNDVAKEIAKRIREYDFTNITEDYYLEVLPYLIFGDNNIITRFVTIQLDEYVNNKAPSKVSTLFGELCIGDHKETIEYLFTHDSESFMNYLAKKYNVEASEIRELLHILELVRITTDEEKLVYYENEYHRLLGNMIVDKLKGKSTYAYSRFLLSSKIFGGNNTVHNNLFEEYATITMYTDEYKSYNLYFDPSTGINCSLNVYYDKLVKLIKSKGNNLDYNDPDCRFLIYLLYLSHTDDWNYDELAFDGYNTPEDMANKLLTDVCLPHGGGPVTINYEFVYAYLTNGYINFDELIDATRVPFNNEFSLALFREFYKCLMEDSKEGNFSYATYEEDFVSLFNKIKENNPSGYKTLMDSLYTGDSLITDINLYPFSYQTSNEDIKKNVYTPIE